jgi:hypothetical protein
MYKERLNKQKENIMEFTSVSLIENTETYSYKVYQILDKKRILIDISNSQKDSNNFYNEFKKLFPSLKFEFVIT